MLYDAFALFANERQQHMDATLTP